MIEQLTKNLKSRTAHCITEEELRLAWLHELQNALGVTFQAERGRNDAKATTRSSSNSRTKGYLVAKKAARLSRKRFMIASRNTFRPEPHMRG